MATPTPLSPSGGESVRLARVHGERGVLLISGALLVMSLFFTAFSGGLHGRHHLNLLQWVLLAFCFGISQLSVVRVGGRSDAEDIEFSSVLLLVASFVVGGHQLIGAAVTGTLLVNIVSRRGWLKAVYNCAHRAAAVSFFVFFVSHLIAKPDSTGMSVTLTCFTLGVMLFGFLEPLLVSTVLFAYRRTPIRYFHVTMFVVAACHTAIGLLAGTAWAQVHHGAPLAFLTVFVYVMAVYLFARVEQRAARAETLEFFIRSMSSSLSREQLIAGAGAMFAAAVRAKTVRVYLFSRDGETGVEAVTREDQTKLAPLRSRASQVWPFQDPAARIMDIGNADDEARSWLQKLDASQAIFVPMFDDGVIVGAVVVADRPDNDRPFDEHDKNLLSAMTAHLGITLEHHRLYRRLQHGALHDVLTDLPNRRLFHQRLRECVDRAQEDGEPFAVLMIDLDGFKEVNDTYGHHVGDELLVFVAGHLRELVRPEDTVARLGGDEFAVVLPAATESDASAVADRVRRLLPTEAKRGSHEVRIGASLGMAGWRSDDESGSDVLRRADAEMYREKRSRQDLAS